MSFIRSIRKRLSKASRKATEKIFHEFPNCEELLNTNKLSIKLNIDYETLNDRNLQLTRQRRFLNIPFLIRDEKHQKITVMNATVEAENGIHISTIDGRSVMYARPPNHTQNCLGKLMNPSPTATMFKIMKQSNPHEFLVYPYSMEAAILKIEKLNNFMGKVISILGADCGYCFKKMDNTVVGYIRPKFSRSSNTLIIKYKRSNTDAQIRAIILGVASLFTITEAYPEIEQMLSQTLPRYHQ